MDTAPKESLDYQLSAPKQSLGPWKQCFIFLLPIPRFMLYYFYCSVEIRYSFYHERDVTAWKQVRLTIRVRTWQVTSLSILGHG